MKNMQQFKDNYLYDKIGFVLDVGSLDVNGTYRPVFEGWEYTGLDIVPGRGVDITSWYWLRDEAFDCVISGQTLEHTEDDFGLVFNMNRVLKFGGYCCLIAPSGGSLHHLPDYRRYTEEMMQELANSVGWYVCETKTDPTGPWHDCVMVARKIW